MDGRYVVYNTPEYHSALKRKATGCYRLQHGRVLKQEAKRKQPDTKATT